MTLVFRAEAPVQRQDGAGQLARTLGRRAGGIPGGARNWRHDLADGCKVEGPLLRARQGHVSATAPMLGSQTAVQQLA